MLRAQGVTGQRCVAGRAARAVSGPLPARVSHPVGMTFPFRRWSVAPPAPIVLASGRKELVVQTMACRAVAQASLAAATASLDDEQPWPLLLVAGWLTTAADLTLQATAADAVLA
jgi:hypothetical protein